MKADREALEELKSIRDELFFSGVLPGKTRVGKYYAAWRLHWLIKKLEEGK